MSTPPPPPNAQLLVSGAGTIYMQNLAVQGNRIIATNTNGSIEFVPDGTGVIGFGDVGLSNGVISTTVTDLDIVLTPDGNGTVKTGNLQLTGNTISTTDTDGDLLLAPNGNGTVKTGNLQLTGNTISSTDTDGDLLLAPNGNGNVKTGNLQLTGNTISTTDTDGDLLLAPNGNGNVGIGTSSPAAKLDVSGSIKADHLSLGIPNYPTLGGNWLTIYAPTFDGNIGDNAPNPEGGILFSNTSSNNSFPWGFYMGTVKYSAASNFSTTRLDIGTSTLLESQFTTTSYANTLSPKMSIDALGNVGIGTSSPGVPLHIGKGSSGSTRAILATANDSDFNIKVVEQSSSNAAGAYQGDFGLYHGTGESFVLRFARGGAGNDGGLSFYTNGANRFNFVSNGDMSAGAYYTTSDDRLKIEETLIKNGLEMCMKLSPQFYTKKDIVESTNETLWKKESGFIAQEIYYDIPELRHIVMLGNDANPLESIKSSSDPSIDPDYSSWGTSAASVNYVEIIPYTVSAIQELSKNQTADNERILELEGEVSFLKEENNVLKQQLDSILGRLSAAGL